MKTLIHFKESRAVSPLRLAGLAVALAALLAGVAAIVAGPGAAAPQAKFKQPKLEDGLLTIKGTPAGETIALRLQAGALQVDVGGDGSADFSFARADVTSILVRALPGDDLVRIDEGGGIFTDTIPTTIAGDAGNDRLLGGSGAETLRGGSGDDSMDGNRGDDTGVMGAGDDTFVWDPGDGSDVIEGEAGTDTMLFNGAGVPEQVDLSANGDRLKFFRVQANITMDTDDVERVDFNALGGADTVTIHDLAATDVTEVNVDLAVALGGNAGDAAADRVVVEGTDDVDTIDVSGNAGGVTVSGLAATVGIFHAEAANDKLDIATLAGDDIVDSGGLAAGVIQLSVLP